MNADQLIEKIVQVILNPIIAFLFSLALLMFVWGIVQFIYKSESEDGRQEGSRHMLYGVIGMFIMIGAKGILELIKNTIGV